MQTPLDFLSGSKNEKKLSHAYQISTIHICAILRIPVSVPGGMSESEMAAYLTSISLPVLSREGREVLDQAITMSEIEAAISYFGLHKSPGLDGYPREWYQLYKDQLVPYLFKSF